SHAPAPVSPGAGREGSRSGTHVSRLRVLGFMGPGSRFARPGRQRNMFMRHPPAISAARCQSANRARPAWRASPHSSPRCPRDVAAPRGNESPRSNPTPGFRFRPAARHRNPSARHADRSPPWSDRGPTCTRPAAGQAPAKDNRSTACTRPCGASAAYSRVRRCVRPDGPHSRPLRSRVLRLPGGAGGIPDRSTPLRSRVRHCAGRPFSRRSRSEGRARLGRRTLSRSGPIQAPAREFASRTARSRDRDCGHDRRDRAPSGPPSSRFALVYSMTTSHFTALADRIDRLNTAIGRAASWCALFIVLTGFAVVLMRYVLGLGSLWLQESILYAHAALFLLAAAWTLKDGGHVRVDVFYASASLRTKAWVDLFGALLLLLPFALAIVWFALPYVQRSWAILERSRE